MNKKDYLGLAAMIRARLEIADAHERQAIEDIARGIINVAETNSQTQGWRRFLGDCGIEEPDVACTCAEPSAWPTALRKDGASICMKCGGVRPAARN